MSETPTGLTATKDAKGVVTLTWVDNSTDEVGFEVQKEDNQTTRPTKAIGPNVTTYIDDVPHTNGRHTLILYVLYLLICIMILIIHLQCQ